MNEICCINVTASCTNSDAINALSCQISSGSVYSVALEWRKPQILPHFQLRHPALAPPSGVETKLCVAAQLQTFHYPMISKPLLSSNAFWTKSFCHTLSFNNVTDRQTNKHKTQYFWLSRRRAKSVLHRHSDRRPRACKMFGDPMHSFAAGRRYIFGGN